MKSLAVCAAALLLSSAVWGDRPISGPKISHPHSVLYRTDADGFPLLSDAGFVQLGHRGPGYFYTATLPEVRARAKKTGAYDRDNWGDPEAFVRLGSLVRVWLKDHPGGPRIGIHEISSEFGGYGDWDGDGRSDHLTHQTGFNFNVSVPSDGSPEVYVKVGVKNDHRYSPAIMRDLVTRLLSLGAQSVTGNVRMNIFEQEEGLRPIPGRWEILKRAHGNVIWQNQDQVKVLLREPPGAHADHLNVLLSPLP